MYAVYDIVANTVVSIHGGVPNYIVWPDEEATHGASVGHMHANTWVVYPVSYVDAGQPTPWHVELSSSNTLANGIVEITRVWHPPGDLSIYKSQRIAESWNECERRMEAASVPVSISGNVYFFGTDKETRENVIGINALIDKERGGMLPPGTIPDPRPFTPKGNTSPVLVSHQEFAIMGATLAQAKDQHVMTYLYHKAVLSSLESAEDIYNYDITVGWPT